VAIIVASLSWQEAQCPLTCYSPKDGQYTSFTVTER